MPVIRTGKIFPLEGVEPSKAPNGKGGDIGSRVMLTTLSTLHSASPGHHCLAALDGVMLLLAFRVVQTWQLSNERMQDNTQFVAECVHDALPPAKPSRVVGTAVVAVLAVVVFVPYGAGENSEARYTWVPKARARCPMAWRLVSRTDMGDGNPVVVVRERINMVTGSRSSHDAPRPKIVGGRVGPSDTVS
ncbi:hypothetical protein BDZ89DRAFT_1036638 [Hymenopellis radicata]|nr:hypothetical protein BDZ89DRAFT_1036638 [Hymenopellis radicata]